LLSDLGGNLRLEFSLQATDNVRIGGLSVRRNGATQDQNDDHRIRGKLIHDDFVRRLEFTSDALTLPESNPLSRGYYWNAF
jgi:hypothetical protein